MGRDSRSSTVVGEEFFWLLLGKALGRLSLLVLAGRANVRCAG